MEAIICGRLRALSFQIDTSSFIDAEWQGNPQADGLGRRYTEYSSHIRGIIRHAAEESPVYPRPHAFAAFRPDGDGGVYYASSYCRISRAVFARAGRHEGIHWHEKRRASDRGVRYG